MPAITDAVLPLAAFSFVSSITPGPNNFMLLDSGARFGLRRTLGPLAGVTGGFMLLLAVSHAGVGAALLAVPGLGHGLALACAAYLLWLAVRIARDHGGPTAPGAGATRAGPMGVGAAVAFQFVNPKAWGMAVASAGIVAEAAATPLERFALLLGVCALVNLPCVTAWAAFGSLMRRQLERPGVRRVFNAAMSTAIVATAAWLALPDH